VGYSGWSPEQLEEEIKQKSWFVASVTKDVVMNSDNDDLWKSILKTMGVKGKLAANLPDDPSLN
jgi:putative transcriptional regulator